LGLSQLAAANVLGLSKGSIELYERGSRRDDGRAVEIPVTVQLSCKYLAQQARLRQQLEALESGRVTMREAQGNGLVDVTKEWAQQIRVWISDLDASLDAIQPVLGGFRLLQIEFGNYGEMVQRKIIGRFATKDEADAEARHAAEVTGGKSGYNEEQGYWWSRDLSIGKAYRYVVESAG
jgi:hypothetical protein